MTIATNVHQPSINILSSAIYKSEDYVRFLVVGTITHPSIDTRRFDCEVSAKIASPESFWYADGNVEFHRNDKSDVLNMTLGFGSVVAQVALSACQEWLESNEDEFDNGRLGQVIRCRSLSELGDFY